LVEIGHGEEDSGMEPGTSLANRDGMLVKIVVGREGVRGESEATRSTKEEVKS